MENPEELRRVVAALTNQDRLIWKSHALPGARKAIDWQNIIYLTGSKWALVVNRDGEGEVLMIEHTPVIVESTMAGLGFSHISCAFGYPNGELLEAIDNQYKRFKKYEYSGVTNLKLTEKPKLSGCGSSAPGSLSEQDIWLIIYDLLKKFGLRQSD